MTLPPPRLLAGFIPYLAVGLGLFVLQSGWAALLLYHLGIVLVLTLSRNWGYARALFAPASWKWLVILIAIGASSGLNLLWLLPLVGLVPDFGAQLRILGLDSVSWIPFILYFSLVNPWLEETLWRGWLGDNSKQLRPVDFFFGGYHLLILASFVHWGWVLFGWLVLATAGWLWRQAARESKSLLPAALSHLAADASILIVVALYALK
jgi:membrane protease YdiL (CAAX protease family)